MDRVEFSVETPTDGDRPAMTDIALTLNRESGTRTYPDGFSEPMLNYEAGSVACVRPLTEYEAVDEIEYDAMCHAAIAEKELQSERWFEDRGWDDARAQEDYEASWGVFA